MPLIQTKGSASSQAYGQFARQALAANYIEDVFSTWLYTGNGSTQTITNGIDLSTKGGLLWIKGRSTTSSHWLVDTARGNTKGLYADGTVGQQTSTGGSDVSGFSSSGFSLGTNQQAIVNTNGSTFASWTFRKQAKFFDVVTWTGDSTLSRPISHILGSVPGFIIVKRTSDVSNWFCYHRSVGFNFATYLNTTAAPNGEPTFPATPTSSVFYIQGNANIAGSTYVGYVFAHDAGGFGASGTDSVIKCGTYTGNGSGSGPVVTLGWEPQWILIKSSSFSNNWVIFDNMRGMSVGGDEFMLRANVTSIENYFDALSPTATGFQLTTTGSEVNSSGATYIYMAIRRGPMRTPTSGTSVFAPIAYTGTATPATITTGIVTDAALFAQRPSSHHTRDGSRLTGTGYLSTSTTDEERNGYTDGMWQQNPWDVMNGVNVANTLYGISNYVNWSFRRAPGFFDVLCYTGDGNSDRSVPHNLSVKPELILVKQRDISVNGYSFPWKIYSKSIPDPDNNVMGFDSYGYGYRGPYGVKLSTTNATNLVVNGGYEVNEVSKRYVAYLFASCAGVSSVGSYTGTGAAQTINCGFTGGARFVLIKRIDPGSPYDWYVWDTARGIVAGNDPYLLLNSTSAEVTGTDYVDPVSSGFQLSSTAPTAINGSGGTFIYLAIA